MTTKASPADDAVKTMGDLMPNATFPPPLNVAQCIAAAAKAMPAIAKDSQSPQGYAYRGIEAVMAAASSLLAKHGVVIVPHAQLLAVAPSSGMKDSWTDTRLEVTWHIYGPAGDHIEARTIGIGRDNSDKGSNKAHTQAKKYLLFDLLNVADGKDDAEFHAFNDTAPPPPPPPDPLEPVRGDMAKLVALPAEAKDYVRAVLLGLPEGVARAAIGEALLHDPERLARVRAFFANPTIPTTQGA